MNEKEVQKAVLNGVEYITIQQFAAITNRSIASIRQLISHGNRIRRLMCNYFGSLPIIPYSEVFEYPFTLAGRNNPSVYHFFVNEKGSYNIREADYKKEQKYGLDKAYEIQN